MHNLSTLDPSYRLEVHSFIDATRRHACREKRKHIYCPCVDRKNVVVIDDAEQIISQLIRRGFMKDYLIWVKHGESSSAALRNWQPSGHRCQGTKHAYQGENWNLAIIGGGLRWFAIPQRGAHVS
jgi:hypothetical protein